MGLQTEISQGLEELEADSESPTFVYQGSTYPCLTSSLRRGTILSIGGHEVEIDLTLFVRKSALPTPITADNQVITVDSTEFTADNMSAPPTAGRKLTYQARQYRIVNVALPCCGSHYEIDLASVNR